MLPPTDAPSGSRTERLDKASTLYGPVEAFWRSHWRPGKLVDAAFGQPASEWLDLSSDVTEHVPVVALLPDGNIAHLAFRSGAECWTSRNDDDLANSIVCTDRVLRARYPSARIETRLLDFGHDPRSKALARIVVQGKVIEIGKLDPRPLRRVIGSDDHILAFCMEPDRHGFELADRLSRDFDGLWRDQGRRELADEIGAKLVVIWAFSGRGRQLPAKVAIGHLYEALRNAAETGVSPKREIPSAAIVRFEVPSARGDVRELKVARRPVQQRQDHPAASAEIRQLFPKE